MASSRANDRIVVGVDFGTTFSGVAFTYGGSPESPEEISVVKNWPGGNNITSEKVPSELAYVQQNGASRYSTTPVKRNSSGTPVSPPKKAEDIVWGYQLKPEQARLRYLKLLLDPRQNLPSYISREDLESQLKKCNKTKSEAVAQFLNVLNIEARDALIKRYGEQMVATTKIDYILTVPAVWSDAAKDATLRAARSAGLGPNLCMVSEPEAAATYALKSMEHHTMDVGDNFIVCDAGGGTVDLIAYEILSMSPLRIEESVPGTGGLCGGAFHNLRFEELVKGRMGEGLFQNMLERKPKSWAIALRYWEDYVKRNFDPSSDANPYDDNKFNVPLPGAEDNLEAKIDCGFITLSTADVREIFTPVVDQVIELVERQRSLVSAFGKTAKGVILVGGFGQSNYLYKALKTRFADEDPPPPYSQAPLSNPPNVPVPRFVVRQPANAWTAVVRGAVLGGLEGDKLVLGRKARRHYGVLCAEPFNPEIHSGSNRYWDHLCEIWRANDQISWHVKKGQTLLSGHPILLDFNNNEEDGKRTTHTKL